MLGHDMEAEGTCCSRGLEVLGNPANDADGRALVEKFGAAHGELAVGDHGYGGSVLARGEGERALGDAIGAGRGEGLS